MNYIIVIFLLSLSALFSGLTLGLMGLNRHELKRKASLGNKNAKKVYSVRKHGNLLLTTLLLGNVGVNSVLAIFLGSIASGFVAGLTATGLIVIFGEIAPQAVFSRFALKLGVKFTWLVRIFIFILWPITRPIAWVLDKFLGEELPTIYSKRELIKIIEEHEDSPESDIKSEEEKIIKGALTFSYKKVSDIMTPRISVRALNSSQVVDQALIEDILEFAHSRFPVYKDKLDNIVGVLYLKDIIKKDNFGKTIDQAMEKPPIIIKENKSLVSVFNAFLRTHKHLFVVQDEFEEFIGVVTMEDILEEIIQDEIMDERDKYRDLRKTLKFFRRKK